MSFQNFVDQHQNKGYTTNYQSSNDGTIVCKENVSKYIYKYKSGEKFMRVQIDGGLISDQNTPKCDYLLLNYTRKNETPHYHSIFIELKGSDVIHACEQISKTIEQVGNKLTGSILHARIVASKISDTKIQINKKKEEFMKKYQCFLFCQCRLMEEESDKNGFPIHSRYRGN
ncbi:MAG: hypothetical protein LBC68_08295 [Prevotellaceae bacterium]|jgi:predicted transcriptional regulator|nr:hypothetical protein [Prevotellaceae bacterium]